VLQVSAVLLFLLQLMVQQVVALQHLEMEEDKGGQEVVVVGEVSLILELELEVEVELGLEMPL
jgi:hypothetical protein